MGVFIPLGAGLASSGLADMLGGLAGLVDAGARHQQAERTRQRMSHVASPADAPLRPGSLAIVLGTGPVVWRAPDLDAVSPLPPPSSDGAPA